MRNSDEKIFEGIWKTANEKAEVAANAVANPQKLFCRGGILIYDKRRKFSKWLIRTGKGDEVYQGVYLSGGGGQWYKVASTYASTFCEVLEKFGIKCRSDVVLD